MRVFIYLGVAAVSGTLRVKNTGVNWKLLFLPDYSAEINILSRSLQNCQVLSCSSHWSPKPSFSWVCVRADAPR